MRRIEREQRRQMCMLANAREPVRLDRLRSNRVIPRAPRAAGGLVTALRADAFRNRARASSALMVHRLGAQWDRTLAVARPRGSPRHGLAWRLAGGLAQPGSVGTSPGAAGGKHGVRVIHADCEPGSSG